MARPLRIEYEGAMYHYRSEGWNAGELSDAAAKEKVKCDVNLSKTVSHLDPRLSGESHK